MVFSSTVFIWVFLPIVLSVNYLFSVIKFKEESNRRLCKNVSLLVASFAFYAWGGVYYLLLMLSVIVVNYIGGLLLEKFSKYSGTILFFIILINLSLLFYFKYFNLAVSCLERIIKGEAGAFGLKEVVLPIGISFYIFQAMSYVIDVNRGNAKTQHSFLLFALYVSLFPQLIAGPIVKYHDVEEQLLHRTESFEKFSYGVKRFCYGLGKKVIIANTLAVAVDRIFALEIPEIGAGIAWFGMISYSLQIYYDFSGYSDMAIGLGKMFGFDFKENFNYPYTALSVTEFWRRWHISLSSWFRDYVYIPLGGNRGKLAKTCLNLFIVFLLTGIWHGANFTFFAWGIYYAIILINERLWFGKVLKRNKFKPLNYVYTILVVMVGWVMFNARDLMFGKSFIGALYKVKESSDEVLNYLNMKYILVLIAAVLFSGIIQRPLGKAYEKVKGRLLVKTIDFILQMAILVYSLILIVSGTYNPFIYFQF